MATNLAFDDALIQEVVKLGGFQTKKLIEQQEKKLKNK